MTISIILSAIGFVLVFISSIVAILCDSRLALIICSLGVIIGCGLFVFFGIKDRDEERDLITEEYTIYLDGVRVDNDKIDISLYNYSIDNDKHVVYISGK